MVQHPKWLAKGDRPQEAQTSEDVIAQIRGASKDTAFLASGLGSALVQIYGRSAELLIERINKLPENYFRAFLNAARVPQVLPKAARTEVTFALPFAEDGPPFIVVPQQTQVATKQTTTSPEVVFETEKPVVITSNQLSRCITFDPVASRDVTAQVNAKEPGSPFKLFKGTRERERILFLGDTLFSYPKPDTEGQPQSDEDADTARDVTDFERKHTVFELRFEFVVPQSLEFSQGDWVGEWYYWDAELDEPGWIALPNESVDDRTQNLHKDGVVRFTNLPVLTTSVVGGVQSYWIACKLTGGQDRDYLPIIKRVQIARYFLVNQDESVPIDTALAATQGGTIFTPLFTPQDKEAPFLPFGPLPQRLDMFYLRADHAFNHAQAKITLTFKLDSSPDRLRDLTGDYYRRGLEKVLPKIVWEYRSADDWQQLGTIQPHFEWKRRLFKGWQLEKITSSVEAPTEGALEDTTKAFTDIEGDRIKLTLGALAPAPTIVNEQEGYWIRARIEDGAYSMPGALSNGQWIPPVTFAPVMQGLAVTADYMEEPKFHTVEHLFSRVDRTWRSLATKLGKPVWFDKPISGAQLDAGVIKAWRPFDAPHEGPALYLGFARAFPAGQWIRMLFDVDELPQEETARMNLTWQFWHGAEQAWQPLYIIDDTKGLMQRDYLGFLAPEGHDNSIEFGYPAFWIRAIRSANQAPEAGLVGDLVWWKQVTYSDRDIILAEPNELAYNGKQPKRSDAFASKAVLIKGKVAPDQRTKARPPVHIRMDISPELFKKKDGGEFCTDAQPCKYRVRRATALPGRNFPPNAPAPDAKVAEVTIDASRSKPAQPTENYITNYILRNVGGGSANRAPNPEPEQEDAHKVRLRGIRLNTVTAVNRETILAEILGASNGRENQEFTLAQRPVLDDLVIEVQEHDPPAKSQGAGSTTSTTNGQAEQQSPGGPIWNEWGRIESFYEADESSRVYLLDPVEGRVTFGDGKRGMIPLAGSKIRARVYGAHAHAHGNVLANTIIEILSATPEVAAIESVSNYEAASGGRVADSVEETMRRGPRAIKHQGRVVSAADLVWLARQSETGIATAFSAQPVDAHGRPRVGVAQVVVVPDTSSDEPRPIPSPAQLRSVRQNLKQHMQANIALDVLPPTYVTVDTKVWLVPTMLEKSESVQRDVRERLATFLHPLQGGPSRLDHQQTGWSVGRDVFVSELYAQVEDVAGVDYVRSIKLHGSMLQYGLRLGIPYFLPPEVEQPAMLVSTVVLREGAQISTFDETKKLILGDLCRLHDLLESEQDRVLVPVRGFNVGDETRLYPGDDRRYIAARITAIHAQPAPATNRFEGDFAIALELEQGLEWKQGRDNARLESVDGRVRLPITHVQQAPTQAPTEINDLAMAEKPIEVTDSPTPFRYICTVKGLVPGDFAGLYIGQRRLDGLWPVHSIELDENRIYIPDGYLVCSGEHHVNIERLVRP